VSSNLQNSRIIKFYRKLTVANFLNWLGIRLFRVASSFCSRLISYAIYLDSSRSIFKKNLLVLRAKGQNFYPYKTQTLPFYTIPEGCKLLAGKIKFFDTNKTIKLSLPKVINNDFHVSKKYVCEAKLPDTYLAELDNVTIFGGTDLILARNLVLYDEVNRNEKYNYGIKSKHIINGISNKHITIKIYKGFKNIDCGIHLIKDHSFNYFHWLVECLPRLSLISELDKNIPLLVDEDIPNQSWEALQLLNFDDRQIIKVAKNTIYKVKKLYYPSQLSVIHDNFNIPCYYKDAVYSPSAINFVRDSVLEAYKIIPTKKPSRKIYISRKNSDYRQLLNTTEIENMLVSKGFEIIFPEHLSFYAQVQIFSEASIIIGQSGAGMANFIFAPKDCKILIMVSDVPQTNLQVFAALIEPAGWEVQFLFGKHTFVLKKYSTHANFYINIETLLQYLDDNKI